MRAHQSLKTRSTLSRILLNSLYFLKIKTQGQTFYKISITTRQIEERLTEVQRDLKAHYSDVVVNLLGLWPQQGNVELYFKYRYKAFNYCIGKLTEYFKFVDVKAVLKDLFDMESKTLTEIELELMDKS